MTDLPDFSGTAAVLADATRAHILTQLLSGLAFTAGELASEAGVSPQTASNHLGQLLAAGFVTVETQGRHRYFRLASPAVAQLLEALLHFEHRKAVTPRTRTPARLRLARSCYDHLAGELGVLIFTSFLQHGFIEEKSGELALTSVGADWLSAIGVDKQQLVRQKRPLLRPCLDWSERRLHLAGAVGAALLTRFLTLRWMVRGEGRELYLTALGQQQLEARLGLKLHAVNQI